jgi:hypothetical protein
MQPGLSLMSNQEKNNLVKLDKPNKNSINPISQQHNHIREETQFNFFIFI